jgi:hypothetical protein
LEQYEKIIPKLKVELLAPPKVMCSGKLWYRKFFRADL